MNAVSVKADVALPWDASLGEGPVWDDTEQKLYWVDIVSGKLFIYNPTENSNTEFDIGEHVGAVAMREKGGLIMAMKSGFTFCNLITGEIEKINDPEAHMPGNRFNEGKCDPSGRLWAGTMSYTLDESAGSLYRLDTDLKTHLKLAGLTISNGMAWNKERDTFYLIDTPTRHIFAFDYNDSDGEISNRSALCEIDEDSGFPDGMTIDNENFLWVALYDGGKVIRIDPADGKIVYEIQLPVPKVTSCTFGGRDLNELYITTARQQMSQDELEQAPLSGSLFKVTLPFSGVPAARFGG